MSRWIPTVVGLFALVSLTLPGALAEAPTPSVPATEKCAPPCGYIWPTIGLQTDVAFPYDTSELPEFPKEIHVTVTYYWDMEQDGTGIPGDAEDMEIILALTKTPDWLDAKLSDSTCSFTLVPVTSEYEVCEVTITTEVVQYPMTEAALDEFGKRLMLFATSKESGTFKQSYGVEDMRFNFDEAPVADPGLWASSDDVAIEESPLGLAAPLAALGAAAWTARRRS